MNQFENKGRNAQQKELVERLESIRRQRNTAEQANQGQETQADTRKRSEETRQSGAPSRRSTRRNEQPVPSRRSTRRNKQQQRQQKEPKSPATGESPRARYQERRTKEAKQLNNRKKSPKKSTEKSSLVKQLSDGQNLADAIVLSEVLSKPIALRNRNR